MSEASFQTKVLKKIGDLFPGSFVVKNDPRVNQGVPDILILFKDKWAMLEFKASPKARTRPNQPYFVKLFNNMSFAAFIHPGNEKKVLNDLQSALGIKG